jgi:LacI family transcriptional regulator
MIKEIAEKAGVSISTVRRALKGFPDISQETKEKVMKIAEELNYRPNLLARAMITKKTHLLGVIVPDFKSSFYSEIIDGLVEAGSLKGYRILIDKHKSSEEKLKESISIFNQYQADGLVITPPHYAILSDSIIEELESFQNPIIILDGKLDTSNLSRDYCWVGTDNRKGGKEATGFLIENGHKQIAFLGLDWNCSTSFGRYNGYREAMSENHLPLNDMSVFEGKYSERTGVEAAKAILNSNSLPTAVLCANDDIAMGFMLEVLKNGISVPGQMSIMGFANFRFSHALPVPLTTVDQFTNRIGAKTFEMLHRLMENRNEPISDVAIPTKIIERKSVSRKSQ